MKISVQVGFNDRSKQAAAAVYDAILAATQETFEGSILPEAKAMSPVGAEPDPNPNRESLQTKTVATKNGPLGKIFSTSGHGGFLEAGFTHIGKNHERIQGRPYIWPAFQSNVAKLIQSIRDRLKAIKMDGKEGAPAELGRVLVEEE